MAPFGPTGEITGADMIHHHRTQCALFPGVRAELTAVSVMAAPGNTREFVSSALRGREVAQYSSDDDFKIVIQILKLKRKKDSAIRGKLMDEKLCVYSSIMADQRKPTTLDEYYMFDDQGYQPNNELGTNHGDSTEDPPTYSGPTNQTKNTLSSTHGQPTTLIADDGRAGGFEHHQTTRHPLRKTAPKSANRLCQSSFACCISSLRRKGAKCLIPSAGKHHREQSEAMKTAVALTAAAAMLAAQFAEGGFRGSRHLQTTEPWTPQDLVDEVVDAVSEDTETQAEDTEPQTETPPLSESEEAACLTAAECEARGYELGYDSFDAGPDLPIRGCFGMGDVVYFGIGGTAGQMAAAVPAGQERITCAAEPEAVAEAPETTADPATTAPPQQAGGLQTEAPETTADPASTAAPQQADGPQTEAQIIQAEVLSGPIEEITGEIAFVVDATPMDAVNEIEQSEFEVTVCLTAAECEARGYELGYEFFDTGSNFPSKGCFGKGNVVYFGAGGTAEQMAAAVPAAQERITCVAEPEVVVTEAPETTADPVTTAAPQTEAPMTEAPQVVIDVTPGAETQTETSPLSAAASPSAASFTSARGGTIEEMSSPELPGARTRVWCLSTFAPTARPTSVVPTPAPTGKPTEEPTPSPTGSPIDWSQLTPGHTRFCGPKIVGGYEIAKSRCSPLTECGKGLGKESAYGANALRESRSDGRAERVGVAQPERRADPSDARSDGRADVDGADGAAVHVARLAARGQHRHGPRLVLRRDVRAVRGAVLPRQVVRVRRGLRGFRGGGLFREHQLHDEGGGRCVGGKGGRVER
ncbi:hypothetical protein THAOC_07008 [Thalassiosira oceanica]|uniref:Uncharacterized protein n=1 Tax=Thalassiosira oceanica TaxID=159749 RepID=K0TL46_THAOC|nr:hypothetical protein THAOC_07008 [Thalassiosira oceanica]|eukprot:EJK71537.1 hypothetical protein THAOC_07008 [Thalassiosira oceanica]